MILNRFMSIYPLWSGVLLGPLHRYKPITSAQADVPPEGIQVTRNTNSLIENYFGVLKESMGRKERYRLGEFVQRQHKHIAGRLNEVEAHFPHLLQGNKKKRKDPPHDKEQWQKRTPAKKAKTSKYFNHPKTIPRPKSTDSPAFSNREKMSVKPSRTDLSLLKGLLKLPPPQELENAPQWGGSFVYKGNVVNLSNTCSLDNLLWMIRLILVNTEVGKDFLKQQCRLVSQLRCVLKWVSNGDWDVARGYWAVKNCQVTPIEGCMNVFGGENERVVKFLGDLQGTEKKGVCNNLSCPARVKLIKSVDFELRAPSGPQTLQQMVDSFFLEEVHPCRTVGQTGSVCTGQRRWKTRQFSRDKEETPPFLILSPTYVSAGGVLHESEVNSILSIGGQRYVIYGYTILKKGTRHFVGVIVGSDGVIGIDGLRRPATTRITQLGRRPPGHVLEHVVFVKEI